MSLKMPKSFTTHETGLMPEFLHNDVLFYLDKIHFIFQNYTRKSSPCNQYKITIK